MIRIFVSTASGLYAGVGHFSAGTYEQEICLTQQQISNFRRGVRMGRILVLQEMRENVENLRESLEPSGHELVVVNTINAAMHQLKEEQFDMIICAVFLENESVFDFLKICKHDLMYRSIPFVFYCCKTSQFARSVRDGLQIAARTLGAERYVIMESFDAYSLKSQVEECLDGQCSFSVDNDGAHVAS
jgi:PleD family two-component response regulator